MAFETMTYEVILKRMMNRVEMNYPNLDMREGSIIFNALAPAAVELAIMYANLDAVLAESFVATASREYLYIACEQMGMDTTAFNATAGTHKGEFNVEVSIGSRWNCDLYNYTVSEYIGLEDEKHIYKMECETYGTEPNKTTGDLVAITEFPNDLTHAKIVECLVEGENELTDDEIRVAYYNFINNAGTDGNINQYKEWCDNYPGVGNYKIIVNDDKTIKISILSASNQVASDELIEEFQNYLDPNSSGMGDGVAPIGAIVTVTTATEKPIEIRANVTMSAGKTDTSVIDTAIAEYFSTLAYKKDTINYMNVGSVILAVDGVESIDNLLIDGKTEPVKIGDEEIPVVGATNWTVD